METHRDFARNISDPYGGLTSWNDSFDLCDWSGIKCGKRHKRVTSIILRSQGLQGSLSPHIGNLTFLRELILYNNSIQGSIPHELSRLYRLRRLDLGSNTFSGVIPTNCSGFYNLIQLWLDGNKLVGSLPREISLLPKLSVVSVGNNKLTGGVPSFLGNVTSLEVLDISNNNLSGQLPQFSDQLLLQFLNLSFNDFEGEVPITGVFANASEFSLEGNIRLCGGLIGLGLPKCKEMKKHEKKWILIVILCSSTIFVILCVVCVWCKKRSNDQPSQSLMNERFLQVSYNQLLNATNGFSESNLIGKGGFSSVYKGILNVVDNRMFVAVKVLSLQNQRALRSFTRECEAWRNIRHRNLLKIITSCSSVDFQGNDFKALVYEFMPNGSLHDWLHSSAHTSRLSLIQRLNILMDIAYALDYLHNRCQTTIVHGDIKPSNILLDVDMVAHVGDFGLARILGVDSNQNSSTEIKGTIGYAPLEYGLGSEMTSNGDVYSFGILLLHVMTGKKPTEDVFNDGLGLHEFANLALQKHEIIDIIDDDVIELQSSEAKTQKLEECLASIIKIGVSCSVSSPLERINMEHVVYELQHVKDLLQNI
ncbi:probable LRR receptor-like serine/threonine-protein kinase At3g47570 [Rutidosis leptorrhynchoides]|uniref:probable LRR receptor-like serine/threonine-protein kinase At3g47570 n=1 Tax=Rutidosis leptorrhynchoides TaxID=125765 RepID=UPI003A99AD88